MCCKKNQPLNLGSSETTREAPQKMQFSDYEKFGKPQHIKNLDYTFLEWFIGFTEGDGSFGSTRKNFSINQKDPKLLFRIKKKLGFGSVIQLKQPGIWRYEVYNNQNCLRLYYLFNGNLSLKKVIQRFAHWSRQLKPQISLQQKPFPVSLHNAWLSGFIEADGTFYARVRKDSRTKTGFQFVKICSITQKGEKSILENIRVLLESKAMVCSFVQNGKTYHRCQIYSLHSHRILIHYLTKYPNLGLKNVAVGVWSKMHGRQERSEHLTVVGLNKLRRLCSLLNKHNQREKTF